MSDDPVYRRMPGWVHRWSRGAVLAMGPADEPVRLEGAAALVFAALDEPRHPAELEAALVGPEVGDHPVEGAVQAALQVLVEGGLVAEAEVR